MSKPRIIFVSLGSKGDLFPYIGLAKEMRGRGYPVVIVSSENYRSSAEAEGLSFESVVSIEEHRAISENPKLWDAAHGMKVYFDSIVVAPLRKTFDVIARIQAQGPCFIVFNNTALGGLIAAEKFGIPCIGGALAPYSRISIADPPKDSPASTASLNLIGHAGRKFVIGAYIKYLNHLASPLNEMRKELGMLPVDDILGSWRYSPEVNIDLWPEWFGPGKADWKAKGVRTGFVDYSGPAPGGEWQAPKEIETLLKRKPVVFTMGSEMIQDLDSQIKLFSQACDMLGRPGIIISAANRGKPPRKINDGFYLMDAAPYDKIFPHASALVSHGGVGTAYRAFVAGIPHLVTPMAFDQFDNAYQIERLNTGKVVPYKEMTAEIIAVALKEITGSAEVAENVAKISKRISTESGAHRACDIIEQTISKNAREAFPVKRTSNF